MIATVNSVGEFVVGGGGMSLALAIIYLASKVGSMTQLLDDHGGRISRLEQQADATRPTFPTWPLNPPMPPHTPQGTLS